MISLKKVAILDSVINDQQPALNGQIVAKYDVINKKIIQKIYMVMELQLQASLPQRKMKNGARN
ncbi:hypothetical protein AAEY33_02895 [Peribacillus simplex]|jgi:hypothetical protein|uniref:hypothetical protein n=1 Tax=Peribacillus simplex TaxID=1478 RepID=UPI0032643422